MVVVSIWPHASLVISASANPALARRRGHLDTTTILVTPAPGRAAFNALEMQMALRARRTIRDRVNVKHLAATIANHQISLSHFAGRATRAGRLRLD
jgi:hypothetical protein